MSVDTAFLRLREANPAPQPELLLDDGLDLAALLEATEQRSTEMQTREPIAAKPHKTPPPRRNLILVMAAIAIAVVVGLVVFLPGDEEAPIADDNQPTVTSAPEAVEEPAPPVAEPVAVAESYFEAFNAGDEAAVLALFAPDIAISDNFQGDWNLANWENLLAWNVAQGTTHPDASCSAADGTVECRTDNQDALVQASNDIGVPTTVRFEVVDGLIAVLDFQYGQPDFFRVSDPFEAYVDAQHGASDEAIRAKEGWHDTDLAESRLNGAARSQLATEWADWGLASIADFAATFNTHDAEPFFALLTDGDSWGPDAPSRESYTRLMATDETTIYDLSNCRTAGVVGETLQVSCDQIVTDAYGGRSGSVVGGTLTIRVQPDGLISGVTDEWNGPAIISFHEDFITWLAATYPEVHASTTWDHILPAAGDYERMIPYIDEFVAQSDVFPMSG